MSATNVVTWKSRLLSRLQLVGSDESGVGLRGNTAVTNRDVGNPGATGFPEGPSQPVRGFVMSGNEEAKRDAERQVSKELANQPKQDGPGKEESKDRRADAEEKLTK
jgi:hypothetical protein